MAGENLETAILKLGTGEGNELPVFSWPFPVSV